MEDVQLKLHKVAKLLQGSYPKYGGLIFHRQLKNDGLICALTEFKKCPADECYATRCKFAIGKCLLFLCIHTHYYYWPRGKESTEVQKSQIKGKESENSYQEL